MVNRTNPNRIETTICIPKDLKIKLRYYARPTKTTKSGQCYETDKEILNRILEEYYQTHPLENPVANPTYPVNGVKKEPSVVLASEAEVPTYS